MKKKPFLDWRVADTHHTGERARVATFTLTCLNFQGKTHWHASDCFCCVVCKRNLLTKPYKLTNGALHCASGGCTIDSVVETVAPLPSTAVAAAAATTIATTPAGRVRFAYRPPQPPPNRTPPPPPPLSSVGDLNESSENQYETVAWLEPSPSTVQPFAAASTRPPPPRTRTRRRSDEEPLDIDEPTLVDGCIELPPPANVSRPRPRRSMHRRERRLYRRSLSVDGDTPRLVPPSINDHDDGEIVERKLSSHGKRFGDGGGGRRVPQNVYSRMPPECRRPTSSNYATTSTSESDSDDDIYVC